VKEKILIVEDQFIEANNLRIILRKAGYSVCSIARSVSLALKIIEDECPDLVLLDIYLQGNLTGIDLARSLADKNIAFIYLSANSDKRTLDAAKSTRPYGFLVKPFREQDVLVMLDIAWYLYQQNLEARGKKGKISGPRDPSPSGEFQNIIGQDEAFLAVLESTKVIGASETTVLLLGESGTGKELIAQGIHRISSRKSMPLIVVNCAALPSNLIESELFGHEKGTFTGATDKRIGKFEQADGGTIFLDEIGELPLDLQVKFLRVLQEREIEPIGGKKKKIDVRIIAATSRNLEEEMAAGRFRLDLYYRLNVFPISLPPLRERKADILLLANHFLKIYAHKEDKTITGLADHVIEAMLGYSWPGNIRELENLMERSVLLAKGQVVTTLLLPVDPMKRNSTLIKNSFKSMTDNERDHILAALEKCNWKIYGKGGAAELLNINDSTLNSRIKKLGITKMADRKNTNNLL
jgi:two-component system, NtrC family, response regulator HydG